jgi:hypothetical protein
MWHFALAWRSVVSGSREDFCFMIAPVYFKDGSQITIFFSVIIYLRLAILSTNDLLLLDFIPPLFVFLPRMQLG